MNKFRYSLLYNTIMLCIRFLPYSVLFYIGLQILLGGKILFYNILFYIGSFLITFIILCIFCRQVNKISSKKYKKRGFIKISNKLNRPDLTGIENFLDSLPDYIIKRMKRDNLVICIEKRKKRYLNPKINNALGYYHPLTNTIKLLCDSTCDFNGYDLKVFLHEFGHYIDCTYGGLSYSKSLNSLLKQMRRGELKCVLDFGSDFSIALNKNPKLKLFLIWKEKCFRYLFYITKIGYFDRVEYGLRNNRELFAELFSESIMMNVTDLVLPLNYYSNTYTFYYIYVKTEDLTDYFIALLQGNIVDFPNISVLPLEKGYLLSDRLIVKKMKVLHNMNKLVVVNN